MAPTDALQPLAPDQGGPHDTLQGHPNQFKRARATSWRTFWEADGGSDVQIKRARVRAMSVMQGAASNCLSMASRGRRKRPTAHCVDQVGSALA